MTAFNVVRFRVKSGQQEHFIAAHRAVRHKFKGFRGGALVRTGEQTFCIIGEWANFEESRRCPARNGRDPRHVPR